jgi:hypothetical protein
MEPLVHINKKGCEKDHHCWFTDVKTWYATDISGGAQYTCQPDDLAYEQQKDAYDDEIDNGADVTCGRRDKD